MKLRIAQEFVVHSELLTLDKNGDTTDEVFAENDDFANNFFNVFDANRNPEEDEVVIADFESLQDAIEFIIEEYPEEENIYKDFYDKQIASGFWKKKSKRPFWSYVYEAKQHDPQLDGNEVMTLREALDLGFNTVKLYDSPTGEVSEVGYRDVDGSYVLNGGFTEKDLDEKIVEFDHRYEDEDYYPCLMVRLFEQKKGEKNE